jgi:hypothetical protein
MDALKNTNLVGILILNVLSALPQQGDAIALLETVHAEFGGMLPTLEPLPSSTGAP